MEDWNIKIVDVGYKLEKDIYIYRIGYDGMTEMLDGEKFLKGIVPIKPTLSLTNYQLEKLSEEISKQGISPRKEFVSGKLEATEKHLEDMRKLVFADPTTVVVGEKKEEIK